MEEEMIEAESDIRLRELDMSLGISRDAYALPHRIRAYDFAVFLRHLRRVDSFGEQRWYKSSCPIVLPVFYRFFLVVRIVNGELYHSRHPGWILSCLSCSGFKVLK